MFDSWGLSKFILSFLLITGLALPSSYGSPGFFSPTEEFSEDVYGAVYKLNTGVYFTQEIDSLAHYQELQKQFQDHASLPGQLQDCFENNHSPCLLNLGFGVNGSAVALNEDGEQVLWTNLHLVRSFLKHWVIASGIQSPQILKEAIRQVNIPLSLKNYRGEIVFDSTSKNSEDKAYFESVPSSLFLPESSTSPLGVPDAVKIRLSKTLPNELTPGDVAPVGSPVYLIGFPKPTESGANAGTSPNSNGVDQYLTRGFTLSAAELVESFDLSPLTLRLALNEDYKYVLDTDCEQGMSGGALLNFKGEFIGLFHGIFSPGDQGRLACIALKPRALRFLESFSE